MEFISKYNLTFINFVNRKYNKRFKAFDEYGLWLYEEKECSNSRYYNDLEQDLKEYCDYQQERKKKNGKTSC